MKIFSYSQLSTAAKKILWKRPSLQDDRVVHPVKKILADVRDRGDDALFEFTKKFDRIELKSLAVSEQEVRESYQSLPEDLQNALTEAASNIEAFHKADLKKQTVMETSPGVLCWKEIRPIEKVGLYIPGGTAKLPSTVLMLGIPALLAGVKEVILCTPPTKEGKVCPEILAAARLCGIKKIFCVGGAQAIAAMAYGTKSIPKVDKIFGPGNAYVTAAKMMVAQDPQALVAIDMPAGPSEVLIIADSSANPSFVAADLLSQAEHGPDSQAILVTTTPSLVSKVESALATQLEALPRKPYAKSSLENGFILLCESMTDALDFSNRYAPEHLIVATKNPEQLLPQISNAGSVFLGNFSPESAGDYASGTNHTLPTGGYARMMSGVSVEQFTKTLQIQKLSKTGLQSLARTITTLAETEGLEAHKNAVNIRFSSLLL